jgi:excisionase family DNA binding protein
VTRSSKTGSPVGEVAARAGRGVPGEAVSLAEPLLDSEGAAALLNVRVSWVRDAERLGHLPCLRVGRHLRFTRVMLEDWLTGQIANTPAAGRVSGRAGGKARVNQSPFRRRTQTALLASLEETPKGQGARPPQ